MLFGLFESARDRRRLELMESINRTLESINSKLDAKTVEQIKKRSSGKPYRSQLHKENREQERRIERHYQNKFQD